jgi:hypothetical protein
MTKPVRYQEGHLYVHHEAWFVRYRGFERVRRANRNCLEDSILYDSSHETALGK